jgi:predicted nucleic-acid-binding protein
VRALLDTNVLVRHLTGDPPDQARRATSFLRRRNELLLVDIILAELVYVLGSVYSLDRTRVAAACRALLAMPTIIAVDDLLLHRSLELYETERLDYAEAYVAAVAELTRTANVVSFDRRLDRVNTIKRVEP